ncbi:uncharacterized protein LOC134750295 [Cydia strobilella]|uniref:uncharacterized protein LOC134750295 n=1 Tax=Cydia strobilella TaxID=1100964 RepID=UPI003005C94A
MILFLIGLSTFSVGLSHASICQSLQQSQLASLNERMNQMIEALYPFSKAKSSGASHQSSTPAPPSEYSTVSPYDPSYYQYPPSGYQPPSQGYQAPSPQVIYMSQPQSSSTVAISPPSPGNPPTLTISTTRSCYPQYEQEYAYQAPKYAPQYYEYSYPQYAPPPPYSASQYIQPECSCQQEYAPQQPCPHRQPAPSTPPQPEYQNCPPAPPCSPPPPYQPTNYPPPPSSPYTAPPSSSYTPPYAPPTPPSYPQAPQSCTPPQSYPPPPQSYPLPPQSYPPPPYTYGPPAYTQSNLQYPPAPTNPRDLIQMPQV